MDATIANKLDIKIIETLDHCISKMADALKKTFDFNNLTSMSLFKSFCSSIRTRTTFMKIIEKQIDKTIESIQAVSNIMKSHPGAKPFDASALSFTPPKKTGKDYQNPLHSQDLQSGLVIKK